MRLTIRFTTLAALATALFVLAVPTVRAQTVNPLLQATIADNAFDLTNPKANTSYFVLDFEGQQSGSTPESVAFAYKWTGSKTGTDMIMALASAGVGFNVDFSTDPVFGTFYQGFGFNEPPIHATGNAFWAYWNFDNAPGQSVVPTQSDFVLAPLGADDRQLANNSWDAWNYIADFTEFDFVTPDPADAPAVPLASAAAPEPGTLSLVLMIGGTTGVAGIVRRRKAARAK